MRAPAFLVAPAVLPLVVHLETVTVVLDRRHPPASSHELRNQPLDEGRLACVGLADNGQDGDFSPFGVLFIKRRLPGRLA